MLLIHFKVLKPIRNLPFYHSVQWNGFFRHLLRSFLPAGTDLNQAGVTIHSMDNGIHQYNSGDISPVGATFPDVLAASFKSAFAGWLQVEGTKGHFQLNQTVVPESVICRITGKEWNADHPSFFAESLVVDEIRRLLELETWTISFPHPLRMKRSGASREHIYCDPAFFLNTPADILIDHLITELPREKAAPLPVLSLTTEEAGMLWLDVVYDDRNKNLGGVVGGIRIRGKLDYERARLLVLGQYLGIGKATGFGNGYYTIRELAACSKILPLSANAAFFNQAARYQILEPAANDLHNPASSLLMHQTVAAALTASLDTLFSPASFAFRKGRNCTDATLALKEAFRRGFCVGIKTSIQSLFASINTEKLLLMLEALFNADPVVSLIKFRADV